MSERRPRGFESLEEFLKVYGKMKKVVVLANDINKSSGVLNLLMELSSLAEEVFDDLVRMDIAIEHFLKEGGYLEEIRKEHSDNSPLTTKV